MRAALRAAPAALPPGGHSGVVCIQTPKAYPARRGVSLRNTCPKR